MPKRPKPDQAEFTLLNSIIEILNEDGIHAAIEHDLHTGQFYILAKTRPTAVRATAIFINPIPMKRTNFITDTITLTPETLADPKVFETLANRIRNK